MRRFKKILKFTGSLLGVVLVLGGLFVFHTWYFKPLTIDLFFARTFMKIALDSPEMMSSIRVLEPFGINGHNKKLDDASLAAGDRFFAQMEDARKVLRSYRDEDLDASDLMSKRIAMTWADMLVTGEKFRFHNYPVNQLFGVQSNFPSFMESTHQVHSVSDAFDKRVT